jgi:hypothetical protein
MSKIKNKLEASSSQAAAKALTTLKGNRIVHQHLQNNDDIYDNIANLNYSYHNLNNNKSKDVRIKRFKNISKYSFFIFVFLLHFCAFSYLLYSQFKHFNLRVTNLENELGNLFNDLENYKFNFNIEKQFNKNAFGNNDKTENVASSSFMVLNLSYPMNYDALNMYGENTDDSQSSSLHSKRRFKRQIYRSFKGKSPYRRFNHNLTDSIKYQNNTDNQSVQDFILIKNHENSTHYFPNYSSEHLLIQAYSRISVTKY